MTKGVSQTMWIVIAIVVFVVIALVVLTIFSQSVSTFTTISEAKAFCTTQLASSCRATGVPPVSWMAPNLNVAGQDAPVSCASFSDIPQSCAEINTPASYG